jgi:hypothetical protein
MIAEPAIESLGDWDTCQDSTMVVPSNSFYNKEKHSEHQIPCLIRGRVLEILTLDGPEAPMCWGSEGMSVRIWTPSQT